VLVVDTALIIPQFETSFSAINARFGGMVGKVLNTVSGPKKVIGVVKDSRNTARVVV